MQFMVYCLDKPESASLRAATRAAHLEYLKGFMGNIVIAGPLLADDGQAMIGSLFLVEFPARADAERFSSGDPYRKAGLFQSVTITPWRKVLP